MSKANDQNTTQEKEEQERMIAESEILWWCQLKEVISNPKPYDFDSDGHLKNFFESDLKWFDRHTSPSGRYIPDSKLDENNNGKENN